MRKVSGIVLSICVLALGILALLSIWNIIEVNFQDIFGKFMWSLLVIFVTALVLLFIFSVLYKNEDRNPRNMPE